MSGIALATSFDWRLFAFAAVSAAVTMAIIDRIPAFRAAKVEPVVAASVGSIRVSDRRGRFGTLLVALQVALSLSLLVSAGLFNRTLWNLRSLDPGFRHQDLLVVRIDHSRTGLKDAALIAFLDELRSTALRQPGVQRASISAITPLQGGGISQPIAINGRSTGTDEVHYNNVDPDYFEVMQTAVLRGRGFTAHDRTAVEGVVVVNETLVRMYFPAQNPLGQHITMTGSRIGGKRDLEIVGVAKDAVYETLRVAPPPTVHALFIQRGGFVTLTVLAPGATSQVAGAIRAEVQPKLAGRLVRLRTMTAQVESSLAEERLMAIVSAVFGTLALALAAVGVYGLLAVLGSKRTHEIGIRMALGAGRSSVLRLVMGDAARMLALGAALGLPAALLMSQSMSTLLFGLTPTDAPTVGASIVVLTVAALLAAWFPARRATRVEAVTALRAE